MIRIIVESHIPYIKGLLEPMARVEYLDTCDITAAAVRDADALLVRTRTRCDASLLEGSRVRFIGTATIGTDHIDLDYCRERGIEVVNAPGCNAPAVAQWVHAALGCWLGQMPVPVHGPLTLGVVGVGHVGSIVARWGRELGYRVLQCDPPRAAAEGSEGFVTLDQVKAQSDVVTFHTPLTREGQWATFHMCDAQFLAQAPRLRLVMNAARGAVCDNSALAGWAGDVAIDCWEHEPAIDRQLLAKALVATPSHCRLQQRRQAPRHGHGGRGAQPPLRLRRPPRAGPGTRLGREPGDPGAHHAQLRPHARHGTAQGLPPRL
jgi:erythronate-4-phosphate dehydrogenase